MLLSQGFEALKRKIKLKTFLNNSKTCISKYNLNHKTIIDENIFNEISYIYICDRRAKISITFVR